MRRIILISYLICLILLVSSKAYCQIHIKFQIGGQEKEVIPRVESVVMQNDSVISFSTFNTSNTELTIPAKGAYKISLSAHNYQPWESNLNLRNDTVINVIMQKSPIALQEVVVKGTKTPTVTATGETFYLSSKARKEKDPFKALSEIPVLNVNPISQSITTRDGSSPLILIDGRLVNSGINPILPADIESVTVEDVVSARYLDQDINKIINIHLRKERPLYVYFEGRTRHDIPLRKGFVGSNFEIGRSHFAVYGSVFYNYLTKDRIDYETLEKQNDQQKQLIGSNISRKNDFDLKLLFKYEPNARNYFAWNISNRISNMHKSATYNGEYLNNNISNKMTADDHTKDKSIGWLGSFFYEHTFKDKSSLDVYSYFNHAKANRRQQYAEHIISDLIPTFLSLDNIRNQVGLDVDYNGVRHKYGQIEAGNHFLYTHDNLWDNVFSPSVLTHVSQSSNYSYISYSKVWKKIMLMTSVGLQGLFVKVDSRSDSYWRPKTSVAIGFRVSKAQTARLSYTLNNILPSPQQLAPVSSSVNPWQKVEGNMNLRPIQTHDLALTYDIKILNWLRLQTFAKHKITTNMIESFLRKENNYVIQSYRNNGCYNIWNTGFGLSINSNSVQAYLSPALNWEHYEGGNRLSSWGLNGNLTWWALDQMAIQVEAEWKNKSYSAISITKYSNPMSANISMAWYPTDNIQISAGITYLGGIREQITTIDTPNYYQRQKMSFHSESFRPWILFAYTIRKHNKLRIENKMPYFDMDR